MKITDTKAKRPREDEHLSTDGEVLRYVRAEERAYQGRMSMNIPRPREHISAEEMQRAIQTSELHRAMAYPSDEKLIQALDAGCYGGVSLTGGDNKKMRSIYGPCQACLEGKMVAPPEPASENLSAERVGQWLAVDLHRFEEKTIGNNIECLVGLDECSGFLIATMLSRRLKETCKRDCRH